MRPLRIAVLAASLLAGALQPAAAGPQVLLDRVLPTGQRATVYDNGMAEVRSPSSSSPAYRSLPFTLRGQDVDPSHLIAALMTPPAAPFKPDEIIVVFRPGTTAAEDVVDVPMATLHSLLDRRGWIPRYTNDMATNAAFAALGVDRSERLFRAVSRSALSSAHAAAESALGRPLLDISNAYLLHVSGSPVRSAVSALLRLPSIAYASPDWRVDAMHVPPIRIGQAALASARAQA